MSQDDSLKRFDCTSSVVSAATLKDTQYNNDCSKGFIRDVSQG